MSASNRCTEETGVENSVEVWTCSEGEEEETNNPNQGTHSKLYWSTQECHSLCTSCKQVLYKNWKLTVNNVLAL